MSRARVRGRNCSERIDVFMSVGEVAGDGFQRICKPTGQQVSFAFTLRFGVAAIVEVGLVFAYKLSPDKR